MGKCFSRASGLSQPKGADRGCTVTREATSQDYGESQEGTVQSTLRSQNLGVAMATAKQSQGHDGNHGVAGTSTSQMHLSGGHSTRTDGSDGEWTLDNITESQGPSTEITSSTSPTDGSDGQRTLDNITEPQGPSTEITSSTSQTDGSDSQRTLDNITESQGLSTRTTSSTSQTDGSDGHSTLTDGYDGHRTLDNISESQGPSTRTTSSSVQTDGSDSQGPSTGTTSSLLQTYRSDEQRTLDNITEPQGPSTGTTSLTSQTDRSDSLSILTDGSNGQRTLDNVTGPQGASAGNTALTSQTNGSDTLSTLKDGSNGQRTLDNVSGPQGARAGNTALTLQTDGSVGQRRLDNVTEPHIHVPSTGNRSQYMVLSERFLGDLASQIGADWQLLFNWLGLTNAELEHIDYDRGFNQVTKNWKAFLLWRKKNKERQASEQLRILFEGFQERGRRDLVDKYTEYLDESNIEQISGYEFCDVEPGVNILKQKLIDMNDEQTREIPLSPVTTDGDNLPIEHLFSSVVIREDVKENRKGKKSAQREEQQEGKTVKSPEDMLTKNGKPVPRVFMLGKAAHGKTTYCKWFLKTWCNTQQPNVSGKKLNEWENALSKFDFVFHIPLRHVDPSRADVIEMICQDILGSDTDLQATAKHVLSSKEYRCFIMMDGLDEWKPDQSVIDRLKYKGMPNIDNMSNCVIFTTMRPWKFSEVQGVNIEDRVIEILGLDDAGIESVIKKVLVHYHEMKPGTAEFEAKYEEITSKLDNETVKSFIKIPLLAVVCVQIWYDGEQVGDSMTSFYVAMVNMLIKRAHLKHDTQKLSFESINVSLPKLMSTKKNIKNYSNVLLKLGKVAYKGLLSKEMKLVFQKDDLETEIGEIELQFALDVGLISQRDVHSVMEEKVSVHFFHKSVQEFLAAIYIVTNEEVSDLFCKHLCDIKVIMELSNVIMFICGMCPCLGCVISQRVVSVADSDTEICQYRESLDDDSNTVKELYKLQVSWHRELEYGQTDSPVTDSPVTFHVSDVYVDDDSDIETVRVTREFLSDHHIDIRSLYLLSVPTDGEDGISNIVVNNLLIDPHRTRSLTKVYINGDDTDRTINKVSGPSLRTLYLWGVKVANTNTVPGPVLCQCDRLRELLLVNVTLGDRDLGLTPSMTLLQEVTLGEVNMTSSGWGRWLQSVIDIHHQFVVTLFKTNIYRHTVSTIHSSPHLSVTRDDGDWWLEFTRVWPLTQDTQ